MDINLSGKKAIVCGSTEGIGKASAVELALLGAEITLIARNEEKLKNVCHALPSPQGQRHNFLVADFTNPDQLQNRINHFARSNAVHILVNNTGGPQPGPALDAQTSEFVAAFSAHVLCNQILVQALVPGMKSAAYGRSINIISTSVKVPIKGLGVSNTIRAAVANWSKTLATELAPFGITVNNVLPGASMTGRLQHIISTTASRSGKTPNEIKRKMEEEIPAGRISDPAEIAAAVAFLATPAAGYITGINVPVDGGRTGSL